MEIRILFLGPARDFASVEAATIEVFDATTATSARAVIAAKFPRIAAALPTMRIAVNQTFVSDEYILRAGDEVALIPPVSGG
jgi:molybdopterin converting factor subunit 1